ncbi:MAG TPA: hypothetical protein VMU81_05900 [Acetobacteraceae bacterium]|nr:hypothetical protein [Acetobacteraceae bacterium]
MRMSKLVHPAFAHLESHDAATPAATLTVVRILDSHYVSDREHELLLAGTPAKVVPRLKAEVTTRAINHHDHVRHVHAAAVAHAGRLVVFPAGSGGEKRC